ncbi:MAG: DNA/RNA non-specific endonuclease [Oligoflexia bacterium]|nr:DNA/RNA non-specific endonuclease [Oligoflexia bacterium]
MYQGWILLLFSTFSHGFDLSPAPILENISLKKTALAISYNREHKQADWVSYTLTRNELRDCAKRRDNFRADPDLNREDASQLSDYAKSGYDRGHLSPAADNKINAKVMSESFLLSNISPQPANFNRSIWARLELLVRAWAKTKGGIQVTTGPVLQNGLSTIGNHVSVPVEYYKVLVTNDTKEAIGLLLPTNASGDLEKYVVSIDRIEEKTKIDFMYRLSNSQQDFLEKNPARQNWNFNEKFSYYPCNENLEYFRFQNIFLPIFN